MPERKFMPEPATSYAEQILEVIDLCHGATGHEISILTEISSPTSCLHRLGQRDLIYVTSETKPVATVRAARAACGISPAADFCTSILLTPTSWPCFERTNAGSARPEPAFLTRKDTTTMPIRITGPKSRPGFDKDEHVGHLLVFIHPSWESRTGEFGEYEVARCAYVACVEDYDAYIDVPVSGAALVPRLVDDDDGAVVVGRLVRGVAKAGRSAPWLLEDPTEKELAAAQEFVDEYGSQAKSGAISLDIKAIERDRPQPDEKF
jgi:hypothetical protein